MYLLRRSISSIYFTVSKYSDYIKHSVTPVRKNKVNDP